VVAVVAVVAVVGAVVVGPWWAVVGRLLGVFGSFRVTTYAPCGTTFFDFGVKRYPHETKGR
jgi:hypothetical protein